jgi:HK97 family phage prohead protease
MPELHLRAVPFALEERSDGDGLTLTGYAAVFNAPAAIHDRLGEYDEVIAPGAFKHTIRNGRPILQFDHGQHPVLGSIPIGTISTLREDARGLYVEARLLDNWMTEPVRQAIEAGAVDGMSFRFSVPEGKDEWVRQDSGRQLRTVREVKLAELGPVVWPAYKETELALRSLADACPELTLNVSDAARAEETTTALPGTSDEPAAERGSSDEAALPVDPAPSQSPPTPSPSRQQMQRQIRFDRRNDQ